MSIVYSLFSAINLSITTAVVHNNCFDTTINKQQENVVEKVQSADRNVKVGKTAKGGMGFAVIGLLGCFSLVATTGLITNFETPVTKLHDVQATTISTDIINDITEDRFSNSESSLASLETDVVAGPVQLSLPTSYDAHTQTMRRDGINFNNVSRHDYFSEIDKIKLVRMSSAGTVLRLYTNTG